MKLLRKLILLAIFSTLVQSAFAQRTDIMFCGTASRTGANLYSGVNSVVEKNGCNPDGNTKALLITRSGTTAGNGANWLAYLNNGGVIVTEWNKSAAVYNEIYGAAISTPTSLGNCADNAMPAVKLNPSDSFWTSNPSLVVTAPGSQGCGRDLTPIVTADNSITPLGGFSPSGVQLARKIQGNGVFFLLEADWQDAGTFAWTASSSALMGLLINGGSSPTQASPAAIPTLSHWVLVIMAGLMALLAIRKLRRQ